MQVLLGKNTASRSGRFNPGRVGALQVRCIGKKELADLVAEKSGLSKKDAALALNATLEGIVDTVVTGEKVALPGFGTFELRTRKERAGRNPKTGEALIIPETKAPAFAAGKQFKEAAKNR